MLYQFIEGYLTDGYEHDPVGVYAIAVTYEYHDIGASAAQICLAIPFSDLQSSYMRYATAEHIPELFKYHVACGRAASALASSNRSWFESLADMGILTPLRASEAGGNQRSCDTCSGPDFTTKTLTKRRSGPSYVWNYFHRSALVLGHHPTPEAIATEAFVLQTNDCSCASLMRPYMIELSLVFGKEIKKAIAQVPLPKAVSVGSDSPTTTSTLDLDAVTWLF